MTIETTLTIPVLPEFAKVYTDSDSEGGPFFNVVFTATLDGVREGTLQIDVDGTNQARLLRRCLAVLEAGTIRVTGSFNLERHPGEDCLHTFIGDSFRAVKQKLD